MCSDIISVSLLNQICKYLSLLYVSVTLRETICLLDNTLLIIVAVEALQENTISRKAKFIQQTGNKVPNVFLSYLKIQI
jgi:hypothetical protein